MAIFGIKRSKVKDIRRKRTLETLKQRRELEERERKRQTMLSEGAYYKAKAERKEAKERAGRRWGALPTIKVKVRKKKQSKKLNGKRRIGLI